MYKQVKELQIKYIDDFLYCEAMKSPVSKIERKFRYQILMRFKLKHQQEIIDGIYQALNCIKMQDTSAFIEINPSNLS